MIDILFVNPIDFIPHAKPQIGQLILNDIVNRVFTSKWINFDILSQDTVGFRYSHNPEENISQMVNYIISYEPKIVGFYTICNSFDIVIELAYKLKQLKKTIILGGPHASVLAEKTLDIFDFIDGIIIGEAESSIIDTVRYFLSPTESNPKEIPGLVYRSNCGRIIRNPVKPFSKNLNENFRIITNYGETKVTEDETIEMEGGRGCPYDCSFCSTSRFWGRRNRLVSLEILFAAMQSFYSKYGTTKFSIVHDHFTANKKHIIEFCNGFKDRFPNFSWACSSRADALDEELLNLMYSSNGKSLSLGIETGSTKMQKELNKNLDLESVKNVVILAKKQGFDLTTSFIYGFYNETVDDFHDTVSMIEFMLIQGVDVVQLHKYILYVGCDEANKTPKEELFFDEANLRQMKMEKNFFTKKGKELIAKHPELFQQFYNFNTDVLNKYKHFDIFIRLIWTGQRIFKLSITRLFKDFSLIDIYNEEIKTIEYCAKEIFNETNRNIYIEIDDTGSQHKVLEGIKAFLSKKLKKLDAVFYDTIFSFELTYYDFVFSKNDYRLLEFSFDPIEYRDLGKLSFKRSYLRFVRGKKNIKIKVLTKEKYDLVSLMQTS